MKVLYFGPIREAGHYLWESDDWKARSLYEEQTPWGFAVDGGLQPKTERYEDEGVAALHHKDGWTALAFWDRSVDTRHASCSVVMADAIVDFDRMVELFKQQFPKRFAAMRFPIVPFQEKK